MQENLIYLVLSDCNQVYLYIPLSVLGVVVTIFHVPVDVVLQCHVFVKILLYSYHKPLAHNNKPLVGLKLTSLLLRPMILNFSFSANFPPYHKRRWQIFDTLTLFVHSTPKHQPDTIQWKDHHVGDVPQIVYLPLHNDYLLALVYLLWPPFLSIVPLCMTTFVNAAATMAPFPSLLRIVMMTVCSHQWGYGAWCAKPNCLRSYNPLERKRHLSSSSS